MKLFLFCLLVNLTLLSCHTNPYDLKYPELSIEGKRSNRYIVNRITNYGNGYQDGCIIGGQISLKVDKLSNDTISGLVFDSKSKEPLFFSTIKLIYLNISTKDTTILIADEKGIFNSKINVIPEKIEINYIGYKTLKIDFSQ